jgi:peroxiredoxin
MVDAVPAAAAAGAKIPAGLKLDECLDPEGFDAEHFDLAEICAGKKVVLLGLPGAFTPC